jgi:hypothetical protein
MASIRVRGVTPSPVTPNLYRTSCFFRDMERHRAFCAQYAIMRLVDDRVL